MAAVSTIPGSRARHSTRARERLLSALPPSDARAVGIWLDTAFFPFQREWVLDFSPYSVINKSRQIGCSHSKAGWCVLCAMLGETTTIVSRREKDVLEVMEAAERHATLLRDLGSRWAAPLVRGKYTVSGQLRLATGGRLIQDVAESGGRGFSGNVLLDEFGYHGDGDEALYEAAAGATTLGGKIHIVSTPNGPGNLFHSIVTDEAKWPNFTRHETTIWDAIREGFPIDPEDCLAKLGGDKRLFGQVYECKFLDGAEQYIPTELIDACTVSDARCLEGHVYAGLDLGFVNDLSVLAILRQDRRNRVWLQDLIECKRTDWETQQKLIEQSFRDYGWVRLCVDRTGVGRVPVELLQKRFGEQRVEAVDFTTQSKDALATGLYQGFADKMIVIPNMPDLKTDLCSLRRTITPSGAVRYDAPRTSAGHADRAWALALAVFACATTPGGALPDYDPFRGTVAA
jgi:phage FluMu gp28-like protein